MYPKNAADESLGYIAFGAGADALKTHEYQLREAHKLMAAADSRYFAVKSADRVLAASQVAAKEVPDWICICARAFKQFGFKSPDTLRGWSADVVQYNEYAKQIQEDIL